MRIRTHTVLTADEFRERLLPFNSFSKEGAVGNLFICPKCKNEMADYSIKVDFCSAYSGFLKYECSRCGYTWRTRTADQQTGRGGQTG